MDWILGAGLLGVSAAVVLGFRWVLGSHRQTVELLVKSNNEIAQTFTRITEATYKHLKDACPIGGLPRDLWLEQHDLRKRDVDLRERQLNVELPLQQEVMRAKLIKARKLGTNGRVTNPEG